MFDMVESLSARFVEKWKSFRRRDADNYARITQALRADVYSAHPEIAVGQVAGLLTRDANDPMPVSEDTLQAILNGTRKLPLHKVGRLKEVLEAAQADRHEPDKRHARRTISELCWQSGGMFVELPQGDATGVIVDLVREFSEAAQAAADALSAETVTDDILRSSEKELRELAAAALGMLRYIETRPRK